MINNKQYWEGKEERAREAELHYEKMKVYDCGKSTIYGIEAEAVPEAVKGEEWNPPVIMATDSVSALYEAKKNFPADRICVLNFASFKNPGGKFIEGSRAQEESLCMESNLYNVLVKEKEYYEWNNAHTNRSLYLDRAIYSEDVVFVRGGKEIKADVLTCAAPNWNAAEKFNHVPKKENSRVLRGRIFFIHDIMVMRNVKVAILGAFGCGVFRQDAREVAGYFKEAFSDDLGIIPVYAVIAGIHRENLVAFQEAFLQKDA